MTSIGRGRGWARPVERESALRRPGQPPSPKSSDVEDLIDRIYKVVSIDKKNPTFHELQAISKCADSVADNHTCENLRDKLWKQMIEDRCFGMKFMKLQENENNRKGLITNVNFLCNSRREIYRIMQESFENREEIRKENPLHVSNITWIIGAVIENTHSSMKRILGVPLIKCFESLMETATEDDIETVAIQLYVHGKKILASLNDKSHRIPLESAGFDDLLTNTRTVLINRNVSARTRALLLLIIDLANQNFEPLTGDLQSYYASIFAGSREQEVDPKNCNGRGFNSESFLNDILTKGMKPENKRNDYSVTKVTSKTTTTPMPTPMTTPMPTPMPTPTPTQTPTQTQTPVQTTHEITKNELPLKQTQKINRGPNGVSSGPFPRAIRGSGASESSKDQRNDKKSSKSHKDKLTDEQVWSAKQNTGSKVWGHDDRFDNDYE